MRALHETQRASYAAQARRLTRVFGRRGSGIEVGSYVGAFLAAARDAGWQFAGVDVNAVRECVHALARLPVHSTAPSSRCDADRTADVVAIWNCLDQLSDPAATLRAARTSAVTGRHARACACRTAPATPPCVRCSAPRSRRSRVSGWRRTTCSAFHTASASPSRHSRALLTRLGFRVEHVVGDVLVPIADQWTRPWARLEERVVKGLGALAARTPLRERVMAPWIEVYARV